jgi:hypothetical protein
MMNTMVWIRNTIVWIVFIFIVTLGLAIWRVRQWFDEVSNIDWGPKPDPDRFEARRIPRRKERKVEHMDKPGFELILMNRNHPEVMPNCIIQTTSLELATYLMNTLDEAFRQNDYKCWTMMIKSLQGGIILGEKNYARR